MGPPEKTALFEEDYIAVLQALIERDFFPELFAFRQRRARAGGAGGGGGGSRFLVAVPPVAGARDVLIDVGRVSLSTFQAQFTTEDDASFSALLDVERRRLRLLKKLAFHCRDSREARLEVAAAAAAALREAGDVFALLEAKYRHLPDLPNEADWRVLFGGGPEAPELPGEERRGEKSAALGARRAGGALSEAPEAPTAASPAALALTAAAPARAAAAALPPAAPKVALVAAKSLSAAWPAAWPAPSPPAPPPPPPAQSRRSDVFPQNTRLGGSLRHRPGEALNAAQGVAQAVTRKRAAAEAEAAEVAELVAVLGAFGDGESGAAGAAGAAGVAAAGWTAAAPADRFSFPPLSPRDAAVAALAEASRTPRTPASAAARSEALKRSILRLSSPAAPVSGYELMQRYREAVRTPLRRKKTFDSILSP